MMTKHYLTFPFITYSFPIAPILTIIVEQKGQVIIGLNQHLRNNATCVNGFEDIPLSRRFRRGGMGELEDQLTHFV